MARTPLTRFPDEFEALLSPRGRRALQGRDAQASGALSRDQFFAAEGLLKPALLGDCARLLTDAFSDLLIELARELPAPNLARLPYEERLHKVARMQGMPTSNSTQTVQYQRAVACGLAGMLQSESYRAFVAALAGHAVDGPQNLQVLCYRPGDYAGPHTDHHPEEERMLGGYLDVHLTFCTPGVTEQLIVYERDQHLSEQRSIARAGTVTAYRLPFWHYTTPLQVSRPSARRWLVLGTFFDGA